MLHRARLARFAPVLALFAVISLVAGACGSSVPALSDPKDIIGKGITNLQGVKTFHVDVTLAGKVSIPMGDSGSGTPFALDGTSLAADIDVANKALSASGSLMGFTAEIRMVGKNVYMKLPAMLAGTDKWIKSPVTDAATSTVTDPQKALDELNKALDTPGVSPTKAADEKIDDQDCYKVTMTIPSKALMGAAGAAAEQLPSGVTLTDIPVSVWVRKSDQRLTRASMDMNLGEMGTVSIQININKFDAAVTVAEPPADEVQDASSLGG